jgi:uncharacterized pyridoxal phosphate-containing UPF0001 family protein
MLDKAPALPQDMQWHFIGHLQSNKVKSIVENVPGLSMVETVDTTKVRILHWSVYSEGLQGLLQQAYVAE